MPVPTFAATDYTRAFLALLPFGRAWSRDSDALPAKIAGAMMGTYARQTERSADLLVDAFPATTVELLPEWEATLGLPDPCAGESPTLQQRQAQVLARLTDSGGSSIAYFTAFAATLGFPITISEFAPATAGRLRAGQPVRGTAWAFAWQVNAPAVSVTVFRAGMSAAGEPLHSGTRSSSAS